MGVRYWSLRIGLLLCLGAAMPALGVVYQSPMDRSDWLVEGSILECRLTHQIPYYGKAVFEHQAGTKAVFSLYPQSPLMKSGKAALVSEAPVWQQDGRRLDLGYVSVKQGKKPISLGPKRSAKMLSELFNGQQLVFTRQPWFGGDKSAEVVLSTVNFRKAHQRYSECLSDLLPVNFSQIERTAIYFPSGDGELRPTELQKLDHIATYVKADPRIRSFVIDGHTDGVGSRTENLELSKKRAERVASMLVERGIDQEKVSTRWHGERYPVASNRSRKGRAENRRVTIRLVLDEGESGPVLVSLTD